MPDDTPTGHRARQRTTPQVKTLLQSLPSVSVLLEHEQVREWCKGAPRAMVVAAVQAAIDGARTAILDGHTVEPVELEDLLASVECEIYERSTPSLRSVINATGIVLHTGLGRAPLSDCAVEALAGAGGYCTLEYDLSTGKRGRRNTHVVDHLTAATGAEAATVVNNNAAATLLILKTFAEDREVVVSRGQLIEIGGSYRLPDIMKASGAALREVGTTNRTRIADFENAINDRTAMLMHVHPSNFRVIGFVEEVAIEELSTLAHRYHLVAVDDLGSGALFDMTAYGMPEEPSVRGSLAAGADLVCFSGDKLLGGPQCGVIVGKRGLIERIEANPLMRTYRVGKLTLLALEATIRAYLDPEEAVNRIPTLSMIRATTDELADRARKLAEQLEAALPDEHFLVCSDVGFAGGGSMPGRELQTVIIRWRPEGVSAEKMASRLREGEVPIIVRIRDNAICLDLRTLHEADFEMLVSGLLAAVRYEETEPVADG